MSAAEEVLSSKNSSYSNMNDDPEYLTSFVNKHVNVHLIKNTVFGGFVHSIDPVSKSVILSIPKGQHFQTTLIPGHAINDITETTTLENITPPIRKSTKKQSSEEILARKKSLLKWFNSNYLPVTEDGDQIVVGSVAVLPPYNATDIYAENPIVALQIRNIMEKMPEGY